VKSEGAGADEDKRQAAPGRGLPASRRCPPSQKKGATGSRAAAKRQRRRPQQSRASHRARPDRCQLLAHSASSIAVSYSIRRSARRAALGLAPSPWPGDQAISSFSSSGMRFSSSASISICRWFSSRELVTESHSPWPWSRRPRRGRPGPLAGSSCSRPRRRPRP